MPDIQRLLAAIDAEEGSAFGSDNDDLSNDRAKAIDYYYGRPFGNEVEGRSHVVSKDVADTIEWIKPSIIRIFTAGDDVVRFDPIGPEDEESAKQESDYVNFIIQQKNDWVQVIYEWATDAMMTRNAYCFAYWDDTPTYSVQSYDGLTDDQFTLIAQDVLTGRLEIVAHNEYPNPDVIPQQLVDPMIGPVFDEMGQPVMTPVPNLHDVQFRTIRSYGCVKLSVLPPERCLVSERCRSMSLQDAPFFEFWEWKTISELREMGLYVPDDIPSDGGYANTAADQARDFNKSVDIGGEFGNGDPSMRRVKVRMVWIRHDYNQDGIAELLQCIVVGREILRMDEVDTIPVACIVPTPVPHRHIGLSVSDVVMDLQEIRSGMLRQIVDNTYLQNNGRYGLSNKVNLDDFLTSRPGGAVRIDTDNADVSGHMVPLVHPFMATNALQIMEYLDQVRENRTGTSRYFTGVDQNALNKTASGIAQLTSAASQRVELMARVFASGVKELFRIVHELTLKHARSSDVIKLRGKWVTVDPRQWQSRSDMTISVGLGVGNKEQLMANLQKILQIQLPALQIGIATPENIYNTLSELSKAAGFPSVEKFWTDPSTKQPEPPKPDTRLIELDAKMKMNQQDNATKLQISREDIAAQAAMKDKELIAGFVKEMNQALRESGGQPQQ
jgi:hypothetical protein